MHVKLPRQAFSGSHETGKLMPTDEDVETIREVITGSQFAEELDDLGPAQALLVW